MSRKPQIVSLIVMLAFAVPSHSPALQLPMSTSGSIRWRRSSFSTAGYTLGATRTTLRVVLRDNDPAGNPVPAITSVTRDTSGKGKSAVLVVRGSGFIESSTVRIAGEAVSR
jgi:hypothetical protein